MNDALRVYRALGWFERAIAMDYAVGYALDKASAHYQVPPGQLATILLVKFIECRKARTARDAPIEQLVRKHAAREAFSAADRDLEEVSEDQAERNRLIVFAVESGQTLAQVADTFGITRERVRQIARRGADAGGGR